MNGKHLENGIYIVENDEVPYNEHHLKSEFEIMHLIIDMSGVNFIDSQGITGILQVEYLLNIVFVVTNRMFIKG